MEQRGLKQIDIAPYMGGKNRISEVMLGKRGLTTRMIRNLSAGIHIPVEALIWIDLRELIAYPSYLLGLFYASL